MVTPIIVTDEHFEQLVLHASVPVVVDFGAPWCSPCRVIEPILQQLANEYAGQLLIAKLNVDEHQRWASQLGIQGMPTLIVFKDGTEVDRLKGMMRKEAYRTRFDAVLQPVAAIEE